MTEADLALRARLRALAAHESLAELSASERAQAERSAEASITHRVRGTGRWTAVFLSLSVAAGTLWLIAREPSAPRSSSAAPVVTAVRPAAPRTACSPFQGRSLGTEARLELDARALLVAGRAAAAQLSLSADCDLEATLSAGSLFVHARKLEGRRLRVNTPLGMVEVHGTVFAVNFERETLSVQVDEGRVLVRFAEGAEIFLEAGEAVRVGARSVQRRPAAWPARNVLRMALGLTPRAERARMDKPLPDAGLEQLPEPAIEESIWQLGSVPAPSFPPAPGSSVGQDGRPLQKPKLIERSAPSGARTHQGD